MANPKTANEAFANVMSEFGIDLDPSLLPGPDTAIPPTNATRHVTCEACLAALSQ